ncbi:MAG: glycosyltransferase [Ferruginibacter sp.]
MEKSNFHFFPADESVPEILFINSFPPRECGIATYSQDLIKALNNKFDQSFAIKICPVESDDKIYTYAQTPAYTLNTDYPETYDSIAQSINSDVNIKLVMIQHEFGFFHKHETAFSQFLSSVKKPVIIVFHTVLPSPNPQLKKNVETMASLCDSVVVMTKTSADILCRDYDVDKNSVSEIAHGTHLVPHTNRNILKTKFGFSGRKIISTFGLLSSGKSLETTLHALPEIVAENPSVLFLIIGKTHPSVVLHEGEKYREELVKIIDELGLQQHVKFINYFLTLEDLLEFLQLTDIYLFTSKDPNQAVSGTFSYALSCGCPIISTPIPHAKEILKNDNGIIIGFDDVKGLAHNANVLFKNEEYRHRISLNALHKMAATAWENTTIAYADLFVKVIGNLQLVYNMPLVNLLHVKNMTTRFGMIQFAVINKPDIGSGYTIDDNARALVAMCMDYELTQNPQNLPYIKTYFNFIKYCIQPEGDFLNYVDENRNFTSQNFAENLEDSNGRAIWALGFLISKGELFDTDFIDEVIILFDKAVANMHSLYSTRAMAFAIKGLYYKNQYIQNENDVILLKLFADRLVQMYRHEKENNWKWFESYLTYGNSILPEALLCAWLATGETVYKDIAKGSFDFLLNKIFKNGRIKVISNKGWLQKNAQQMEVVGGEQPIDIAYTIMALKKFNNVFPDEDYSGKMKVAFSWFLGNNHLRRIMYNPCTGGCYDGLEDTYVNLNQGAESTVSYLMARLCLVKLHMKFSQSLLGSNFPDALLIK